MRKLIVVIVSVLVFGAFALAQVEPKPMEVPKTELFIGYAYEHADTSGSSGDAGRSGPRHRVRHHLGQGEGAAADQRQKDVLGNRSGRTSEDRGTGRTTGKGPP